MNRLCRDFLSVRGIAHIKFPFVLSPQELSGSSPKRRRVEEKDEGIGSPDILEEEKAEDLRRDMIELRQQLEKERSVRMMLEDQVKGADASDHPEGPCHTRVQRLTPNISRCARQMRSLDEQLYPEKPKAIAHQVQEPRTQSLVLTPAHSPQVGHVCILYIADWT